MTYIPKSKFRSPDAVSSLKRRHRFLFVLVFKWEQALPKFFQHNIDFSLS